ncbi:galactitol-1-phosphate 5-dehydrogenase [Pectinatus sottacetonis]|uniref:galactitol-1-phosphate 5-dehydrogenase n=1 Tax=Pectinatus sottacetonis TaxID=1002795 RepID=UPI0018C6CCA7|nr:galactitol-1-phosphate 5-dehydrogenase [Pectinatus sottacetonis]
MRAAVLKSVGRLEVEDVSIPDLGTEDVLVKVSACGICGSDLPRILTTGTYNFPTIPGHEFGGKIYSVGSKKYNYLIGKKVAVNPLIPCYHCEMCEIGMFEQCRQYDFLGSRSNGGFSEYVKVPIKNIVLLPEAFDDKAVVFLEPSAVALHVVQNCRLKFGENVVVFGLGAIGMFIAQWAKAFGAEHVFAIDIDEKKVILAKQLGLQNAYCSLNTDIKKVINELTEGVDFVAEASGSATAFKQGISLLRQSGRLGLVGRFISNVMLEPQIFEKILRLQLCIQGTWSFETKKFPYSAWKQSVNAIVEGKIKVMPLISHTFPLEKIMQAVKFMSDRKNFYSKILILP